MRIWIIPVQVIILLAWNTWQDCRKKEIVPVSLWIFLAAGLVTNGVYAYQTPASFVGGILTGGGLLLLSCLSRGAIGRGDGYLLCVAGVYLGIAGTLSLLLGAFFLCAIWSLLLLVIKKAGKKTEIPFVPFLLAAYVGGLLF